MRWFLALFTLAIFLHEPVAAQQPGRALTIDTTRSTLAYTGQATAHDWTGSSQAVAGSLYVDVADPARSRVVLQVPVASFDSGNRRRDAKMRDVTGADRYPDVHFRSERIDVEGWGKTADGYAGTWRVEGPLTFHGQTHPVTMTVVVRTGQEEGNDVVEAEGEFRISLEQYGVERPRLLFVPIRDGIEIEGLFFFTGAEERRGRAEAREAKPPPNVPTP